MPNALNFFSNGKLMVSIVNRHQGEKLVSIARSAGASGSTIISGRGTATNKILEFLALGDSEKAVVLTALNDDTVPYIIEAIKSHLQNRPKDFAGIIFTLNLSTKEGTSMENKWKLISVIVNAGYADEAMAAARKAGAFGGTVIDGRGTGTDEDVKFFGITIVPEKELLLILTETEKEKDILNAIRSCKSLEAPGSGIIFSVAVEDFYNLGKM